MNVVEEALGHPLKRKRCDCGTRIADSYQARLHLFECPVVDALIIEAVERRMG